MAEGVGPGVGSWGAPGGAAGAGAAALEACKAGGWACSVCCWAEESESLSLSWGLGMLGDVLRLSWSMSLGSLLPSSLTLRLSELSPSPSDGELGRLISWGQRREGGSSRRVGLPLRLARAEEAPGLAPKTRGPALTQPVSGATLASSLGQRALPPQGESAGGVSRGISCQL